MSPYPAATWVNTTRYCKYSQVLLTMGENIARNMYSRLGIKINLYSASCWSFSQFYHDERIHEREVFKRGIFSPVKKNSDQYFAGTILSYWKAWHSSFGKKCHLIKFGYPGNCLCHNTQLSRSPTSLVTHRSFCTTSHGTADVYDVTEHARQTPAVVYWSLMTSWAEL